MNKKMILINATLFILMLYMFQVSAITVSYNYSEQSNIWGTECNHNPGVPPPPTTESLSCNSGPTFSITTSTALDSSDDFRELSGGSGGQDFPFQLFNASIQEPIDKITSINWTWEGRVFNEGNIYLWNTTSNSAISCGSTTTSDTIVSCISGNETVSSIGISTFYAMSTNDTIGSNTVQTDYLTLSITYNDLIINTPSSNQEILNTLSTTLNISTSGYNHTIWYTWNDGRNNYTICDSPTNLNCAENETTITFPRQGYYNLSVYGNKSDGSITSKTVSDLFVGNFTLLDFSDSSEGINATDCDSATTFSPDNPPNTLPPPCFSFDDNTINSNLDSSDDLDVNANPGLDGEGYHYFKFNTSEISGKNIDNMTYHLEGATSDGTTSGFYYYVYNNSASDWFLLQSRLNTISTIDLIYSNSILSSHLDFITSNITYTLWTEQETNSHTFSVDYTYLNITYYDSNSPPNITLITNNLTNFSQKDTINLTFNLSDDNDYVINASLYLCSGCGPNTYFPNSSGNTGYNGTDVNMPPTTFIMGDEIILTAGDLNNISVDDNNHIHTTYDGGGNEATGVRINYSISESISDIDDITISVSGNATGSFEATPYGYNFTLYIWNTTTWEYLIHHNNSGKTTINYTLTSGFSNYINNNQLSIMVMSVIGTSTYPANLYFYYSNLSVNSNSFTLNQTKINPSLDTKLNFSFNIEDGTHQWYVEVCDSDHSCTNSEQRDFTVDKTLPILTIISPIEQTYRVNDVDFNVSSNEALDSCVYSLDNTNNITLPKFNNTYFNFSNTTMNEGPHNIVFCCNDSTFGNTACTLQRNFGVDTFPPIITLNYPSSNIFLNYNNVVFNYTPYPNGGNLSGCQLWGNWSNGWHTNQTNATQMNNNTVNNFTVPLIEDGTYKWNVNCTESTGNQDYSQMGNITFSIDTIFPQINLTSVRNTTYTTEQTSLNYTRNDTHIDRCWYSIDNGVTNSTPTDTSCNNFTVSSVQGSAIWYVYINDSAGNFNYSNYTLYVDSINPNITITTNFTNNSYLNYNHSILFNLTAQDGGGLSLCWYSINKGVTNTTISCGSNVTLGLAEGFTTFNYYANDTLDNRNFSESISFTPDITFPNVSTLNITTTQGSQTITINANISDINLDTCWYTIRNSTGGVDTATTENTTISPCSSGVTISESDTVALTSGVYNITIYAKDSAGNENSSTAQFTTAQAVQQPGGGGGTTITILGIASQLATNFSILTTNFFDTLDISLPKDSVRPRKKEFILVNRGLEPIEVEIICDTTLLNETQNINMCDYVEIPITSFNVSPNEQEISVGRFEVYSPENSSFGDKYFFNLLAVQSINNETVRYSKLSVKTRVSIFATLLKWSSLSFGTQSVVDGVEEPREISFPVTPISLIFSFLVAIIMFVVFFRIDYKLTGFFVSVLTFSSLFFLILFVL